VAKKSPKASAAAKDASSKRAALTLVEPAQAQIITQPSVRVAKTWAPSHLRSVMQSAEGGDLFQLGDLCDQMLADDRIGELLEQLVDTVLGSTLSFEKDQRSTVGDAPRSKEITEDWTLGWTEDELAQLVQWMIMIGVGHGRHEAWMNTATGRMVPRLRTWHPRHFMWKHDDKSWFRRDEGGNLFPVVPGDGEWVVLSRRGDFRPWASGAWRGLAPWWILKRYAISDWGVHTEKGSRLVVEADEGVGAGDRRALADEIFELAKDQVISLPSGFKLSLIELTANTRDIYQAQIDAADMAFAISLLGQNLTSRVDGGSYAAGKVHERVANRRVVYVAKRLSHGLYGQSLNWWAQYNFGSEEFTPYPRFCVEPPEDKTPKVAALLTLGQALSALKTVGLTMTPEQIEEEYGVQLTVVAPTEPTQPQPGEPARGGGDIAKQPELAYRESRATPAAGTVVARDPSLCACGAPETDVLTGTCDKCWKAHCAKLKAPQTDKGANDSQDYADQIVDELSKLTAVKLDGFVSRVLKAIDEAEDYEGVKTAVLKAFSAEADPETLRELAEKSAVLANLAGRLGVKRDQE
jgi:phage gp29-like protein